MNPFIHLADSHLRDTQFTRRSRGEDFARSLTAAIQLGAEQGIKTFLHAGDLIDSVRPGPKVVSQIKALDTLLTRLKAVMLVISGNHDYTQPHWAEVACPEITGERPHGIRVIDNQLVTLPDGLTVYGCPFMPRERFLATLPQLPAADVLLFHAAVRELMPFKSDAALTLDELPYDRYKMIALGDIHIFQYLNHHGCLVGYPGSTELCAINEPPIKSVSVIRPQPDRTLLLGPKLILPTRSVLRYTLQNEEDLEKALADLQQHLAEDPIVRIDYVTGLADVLSRFSARIDPNKAILRIMPLFAGVAAPNQGQDERSDLQLADMVEKIFPPGGELHALTTALIDPQANVSDIIDRYVEEKIASVSAAVAVAA